MLKKEWEKRINGDGVMYTMRFRYKVRMKVSHREVKQKLKVHSKDVCGENQLRTYTETYHFSILTVLDLNHVLYVSLTK
jgi:hypothetical protein